MTNSKRNLPPEKVLDNLIDLLADEQIEKKVEEPIDLAAQVFRLNIATPITHSEFNRVIAAFVRHIFQSRIQLPRHLSDREALSEAVFLLERYYQNEDVKGYDVALIDAIGRDTENLELVLSRLTEFIKMTERGKYVKWAFVDNYYILDWCKRQSIVSTFIKQNETWLPPELVELDPARHVNHFNELFLSHISTESSIRQVFSVKI
jgi:hypothetical protein